MNQFMGVLTDPFIAGRGDGASRAAARAATGYASTQTDRLTAARRLCDVHQGAAGRRSRSSSAGACGRRALAARRPPTAMRRSAPTPRPAASAGTAVGADYRFSPNTIAGFALAGGGTSFSVANGGSGRSDLFQAGAFVRHTVGPAYISGALAYGWQDVTTNRTVTIAGIDQLRARVQRQRLLRPRRGRLSLRHALDRRHRHHALRRRTVHHLRSAGLCRAGGRRHQHLRAGLWRQERHRHAQRTRHSHRQILCDAGRDPDAARPFRLGA